MLCRRVPPSAKSSILEASYLCHIVAQKCKTMEEPPRLNTNRLHLRLFTPADAPELQRLISAREIASTTLNVPHPYANGMAEQWITAQQFKFDEGLGFSFAIIRLRHYPRLIGGINLNLTPSHHHGELAYWIGMPFWQHGYCTEAAAAVLHYGFSTIELHRIHATHMTRNPASGRVMQKIGMIYEGCLRQHYCKWGVFEDVALYGILRSDYDTSSGQSV